MRLFSGIGFTTEVRDALGEYVRDVCRFAPGARPTPDENFHLTMRFLGETAPGEVAGLCRALDNLKGIPGFSLSLSRLGAFGRGDRALLWLGLERCEPLLSLHRSMSYELDTAGFPGDGKPFSPHVTLARDACLTAPLPEIQIGCPVPRIVIEAGGLTLFESTRVGGKLRYVPLHTVALSRPPTLT